MDKTEEAKFYIEDSASDVIEVFFSREDFIGHLSSMVLIYDKDKDVFLKTHKEK